LTREHYENFPVASWLIPKEKRRHVCALYAFARIADDFADESGLTPAERIDSLNEWDEQLTECYRGHAEHPVFVALRETVDRFEIPRRLFQNLLFAFRSDVTTHRYETFDDLLHYCDNSANPIGRLVLLLFGYRGESLMLLSDAICTGLQLTNFWQDVLVDLEKDRVYIPMEDIREFGYSEEELFEKKFSAEFKDIMVYQVERTERLFLHGRPLLGEVGTDLRRELKLTWNGGMKILKKIEMIEFNVLQQRPTLTTFDKTGLVVSSFFG
ncbi:MAG TPA: squalene synthase HpnC, partial [Bacteroidetes bacterium]|nr:squalene synthase HpnC [Bacteroidota bacterium]